MGNAPPTPPSRDGGCRELAQSQARGQGRAHHCLQQPAVLRTAVPASLHPNLLPHSTGGGLLKRLGLFSCLLRLGRFVPIDACLEKSSRKKKKETQQPTIQKKKEEKPDHGTDSPCCWSPAHAFSPRNRTRTRSWGAGRPCSLPPAARGSVPIAPPDPRECCARTRSLCSWVARCLHPTSSPAGAPCPTFQAWNAMVARGEEASALPNRPVRRDRGGTATAVRLGAPAPGSGSSHPSRDKKEGTTQNGRAGRGGNADSPGYAEQQVPKGGRGRPRREQRAGGAHAWFHGATRGQEGPPAGRLQHRRSLRGAAPEGAQRRRPVPHFPSGRRGKPSA